MYTNLDSTVLKKYKLLAEMGRGAFGIVYRATCLETREMVALKYCKDALAKNIVAQGAYQEAIILKELRNCKGFVQLREVVPCESPNDLYMTFECLQSDLGVAIESTGYIGEEATKIIMYQVVRAVSELHSRGIIHRDLKPQNVLVNCEGECFISDFGLSTSIAQADGELTMNGAIGTFCYNAPELHWPNFYETYTTAVDIWALGCILADLLRGYGPLFTGQSVEEMRAKLLTVVGYPSAADIDYMGCDMRGFEYLDTGHVTTETSFDGLTACIADASDEALDFLRLCLQFNPSRRPTASELLEHPFLLDMHGNDCPEEKALIDIPIRCNKLEDPEVYREAIYDAFEIPKLYCRDSTSSGAAAFLEGWNMAPTCRAEPPVLVKPQTVFDELDMARVEPKRLQGNIEISASRPTKKEAQVEYMEIDLWGVPNTVKTERIEEPTSEATTTPQSNAMEIDEPTSQATCTPQSTAMEVVESTSETTTTPLSNAEQVVEPTGEATTAPQSDSPMEERVVQNKSHRRYRKNSSSDKCTKKIKKSTHKIHAKRSKAAKKVGKQVTRDASSLIPLTIRNTYEIYIRNFPTTLKPGSAPQR